MDDKKFDSLARLIGAGASRRTILKGILGLGGATLAGGVASHEAEARTLRTRPRITTGPPPSCILPKQMCGGECCEAGHCHEGLCCNPPHPASAVNCGSACCDTGLCTTNGACCEAGERICGAVCCASTTSCSRNGNLDICCDPETHFPCGLDCCEHEHQCCDGECCAEGDVCLSSVYDTSGDGFEEHCCPIDETCGGGCCVDGTCYDSAAMALPVPDGELNEDHECCPAGGKVCAGGTGSLCCDGETPQCCHRDGVAICIAEGACCTDGDCDLGECDVCDIISDPINSVCVDSTEICNETYGNCSICVNGTCVDSEPHCGDEGCLTCMNGQCIDDDDECPGDCSTCFSGACVFDCTDGEDCCDDPCSICNEQSGACVDRCPVGETCCPGSDDLLTFCRGEDECCYDGTGCGEDQTCCQTLCFNGGSDLTCCDAESGTGCEECEECIPSAQGSPVGVCAACATEFCCDGVCQDVACPTTTTTTSTTTTSTTTTTTTTTTRDPNRCLERLETCDVEENRCCVDLGLGCFEPLEGDATCDNCLGEDDRCGHDSECCLGYLCLSGNCGRPVCRENSECLCATCNDDWSCDSVTVGEDPNNDCGPCKLCESDFSCGNVENGQPDPLGRCPSETDVCCWGACAPSDIPCASCQSDPDNCGPCFKCVLGACVPDCTNRTAENACCSGCQTCDPFSLQCLDDSDRCVGDCTICQGGVCRDHDDECDDCEQCEQGRCTFDCVHGGPTHCCDAGECGRAYCRTDGSCVVEADPNAICGPCRECELNIRGAYECQTVADGEVDPSGICQEQICCGGSCSTAEDCACTNDDDCGPCFSCFNDFCIPDCTRSLGGSCCTGCALCYPDLGICADLDELCGECGECIGGECVDDDRNCGDCERCFDGTCVFNCHNEEGAEDCCEDTGDCGAPLCDIDGACRYVADAEQCLPCETCVGVTDNGPFYCQATALCECSSNSDCGPCATCDENSQCVPLGGTEPRDGFSGVCCDGLFVDGGECCDACDGSFCVDFECVECSEDFHCTEEEFPHCTSGNICLECRENEHCDSENPCILSVCDEGFCDSESLPAGTQVDGGICCHAKSEDFATFVEDGECCGDADCGVDDYCCANRCQGEPTCGCSEANDTCGPCATCVGVTCEPVSGIEPRDGYFGVCCNGQFIFEGSCCDDDHCDSGESCRVHACVECLSDQDCQPDELNPCRIYFCDQWNECDFNHRVDGPFDSGVCCEGDFFPGHECCVDGDCAELSDTPFCNHSPATDSRHCAACRRNVHCSDDNPCTIDFCDNDSGTCGADPIHDAFNPTGPGYCCNGVLQTGPCGATTTIAGPGTTTTAAGIACNADESCVGEIAACANLGPLQICACVDRICQPQTLECVDNDDCLSSQVEVCAGILDQFCICGANNVCIANPECTSAAQCDDGKSCTTDTCVLGQCVHPQVACPTPDDYTCLEGHGCKLLPGRPCSFDYMCASGLCVPVDEFCIRCYDATHCRSAFGPGYSCDLGSGICVKDTGLQGASVAIEQSTGVQDCVPATCEALGLGCGSMDDGCGGVLDCGECEKECIPTTCDEVGCGGYANDCVNGDVYCGDCPTAEVSTPAPIAITTPAQVMCRAKTQRCASDDQCCDGLLCRSRTCRTTGNRSCRSDCAD